MNSNLIFNGEGPMMSGTWYNPTNGDSFTVADSFFQDNQYIVKTTDGRMLDYNFIQNYVKSDKPLQKMEQMVKPQQSLPPEVASIIDTDILDDDLNMIKGNLGNLHQPTPQAIGNTHIIEKALGKKSIPNLNTYIAWDKFPSKELEMLFEIMEIDKSEVLEWYLNKIDLNIIKKSIKESLEAYIDCKLTPDQDEQFIPHMCSEDMIGGEPQQIETVAVAIETPKSKKGSKKVKK